MRIGIISDIHSNLTAFKLIMQKLQEEQVEKFFFLGDYITDGYQDNEVLDIIKNLNAKVILGNREGYIINIINNFDIGKNYNNKKTLYNTAKMLTNENKQYISGLPSKLIIELYGIKILLIHGNNPLLKPQNFSEFDKLINNNDFDVCFYGHIHKAACFWYKDKLFINPGSCGEPIDGPYYSCGIFDISKDKVNYKRIKISTEIDYLKIEKEYKQSPYYHNNPEWGDIVLRGITKGNDEVKTFINKVNEQIKNYKYIKEDKYNNIWYNCYNEIIKRK